MFDTDTGVSTLLLKEVPYKQIAYVKVQSVQPGGLREHLKECVSFCRMCGAERVLAQGHSELTDYPVYCSVLDMRLAVSEREPPAMVFPVTEQTVRRWRDIYNEKMASVDNAATLTAFDEKEILSSGALLHGIVGAELAREKFGVTDEEILSAIRCHTMGKPDMTPLELNIFVADAIEMNREPYEGLEKIRCLAQTSLRCAALQSFYGTRDYVLSQGKNFAGRSCDTMRDLESRLTEEEKMLMHA